MWCVGFSISIRPQRTYNPTRIHRVSFTQFEILFSRKMSTRKDYTKLVDNQNVYSGKKVKWMCTCASVMIQDTSNTCNVCTLKPKNAIIFFCLNATLVQRSEYLSLLSMRFITWSLFFHRAHTHYEYHHCELSVFAAPLTTFPTQSMHLSRSLFFRVVFFFSYYSLVLYLLRFKFLLRSLIVIMHSVYFERI